MLSVDQSVYPTIYLSIPPLMQIFFSKQWLAEWSTVRSLHNFKHKSSFLKIKDDYVEY